MEQSSFKAGSANSLNQNKPSQEDARRVDEYGGQYRCRSQGTGDVERFGTDKYPVQHDALAARGLRNVGG